AVNVRRKAPEYSRVLVSSSPLGRGEIRRGSTECLAFTPNHVLPFKFFGNGGIGVGNDGFLEGCARDKVHNKFSDGAVEGHFGLNDVRFEEEGDVRNGDGAGKFFGFSNLKTILVKFRCWGVIILLKTIMGDGNDIIELLGGETFENDDENFSSGNIQIILI